MRGRWGWGPIALAVALVAVATLGPGDSTRALSPFCVLCGERGSADAVVNVVLFLPLGMAFAARRGWVHALLAGAVLSSCVEIAQTGLPGRFPTIGDILWNTLGAGIGALLWRFRRDLLTLRRPWGTVAGAVSLSLVALPALLTGTVASPFDHYVQWAPTVAEHSYEGSVTAASLDGVALHRGRLEDSDEARRALARGAPLRVSFVAAAPPQRLSAVLRFLDAQTHEIAALGVRGNDLTWTARNRAIALGFGSPDVVWRGALSGVRSGAEVDVVVRREDGSLCMRLDGLERCGLRPRMREGWRLLLPDPDLPMQPWLAFLWLVGPVLIAGCLMAREPRSALVLLALEATAIRFVLGMGVDAIDLGILFAALGSGIGLGRLVPALGARGDG